MVVVGKFGMWGKWKVNGKMKIFLCVVDGVVGISVLGDVVLLCLFG